MSKNLSTTRLLFTLLIPVFALFFTLASGCTPSIGDECTTGRDCPIEQGSVCDSTVENGYCLVQNCNTGGCPADSACVIFDRNNSACMALCESDSECRAGFACRKDYNLEGSSVGYCYTPAASPAPEDSADAGDNNTADAGRDASATN